MQTGLLNPARVAARLWQHRAIIAQLVRRDVLLRYRGTYLGLFWAILHPLLLLAAIGLVAVSIFPARFEGSAQGANFLLGLYCGLIAFTAVSEVLARAPAAVRSYPAYVKKVIFPVDTLPVVVVGTALAHAAVNLLLLVAATMLLDGPGLRLLLLPVAWLPLVLLLLGLAWLLAAWGVFLKDLAQIAPVVAQVLLFLSPVLYPVSAVPVSVQPWLWFNPLTPVIEQTRAIVLRGAGLDWGLWATSCVAALALLIIGYAVFAASEEEFPDVV